jgi:site-specific recombinase XerC
MTPIAPHITAFLQKRLAVDRRASPHTCDTYAYAFQLLFQFMSRALGVAPADLALEQLDAPLVLQFLDHLQQERHNSPRTRNARLAAIRSFMRFGEYRVPSALDQVRRVRAIPAQRTDTRIVRHLSVEEHRALLDAPEPTTRLGIRDRAMLLLALAGGLRVSELVGLRLDEVQFNGRYVDVRVRGKGRRERALTLWKSVGDTIRAWLAVRGEAPTPELFLNAPRPQRARPPALLGSASAGRGRSRPASVRGAGAGPPPVDSVPAPRTPWTAASPTRDTPGPDHTTAAWRGNSSGSSAPPPPR